MLPHPRPYVCFFNRSLCFFCPASSGEMGARNTWHVVCTVTLKVGKREVQHDPQHLWVVRLPDTQFAAGACTCAAHHTRLTTRSLSALSPLLKLSIRTTLNRTPTHTPTHLSPLLKLITRCWLWRHAPPKGTWRGGDSAIPFRPSPTRWASRRPWWGSAFVLFSPSIPPSSCMFDVWKVVVPLRRSVRVLVS